MQYILNSSLILSGHSAKHNCRSKLERGNNNKQKVLVLFPLRNVYSVQKKNIHETNLQDEIMTNKHRLKFWTVLLQCRRFSPNTRVCHCDFQLIKAHQFCPSHSFQFIWKLAKTSVIIGAPFVIGTLCWWWRTEIAYVILIFTFIGSRYVSTS